jgi:signal peptidase I
MRVLDRATSRLPHHWRTIVDWAATIAFAIAFVLVFEAEVAKPYRIPSPSMEPTLHCARPATFCLGSHSDRIIANRLDYKFASPKRGQIVVFTAPLSASKCGSSDGGTTFVKRLIGLPGDTVSEREGSVLINDKPLIAPNHYFFLGDDRTNSCDSRIWGTVPRSSLIGPAIVTYWPPSRWTSH